MEDQLNTEYLPGRTLLTAGKEYLYFSGTSYLGMARNADFQACLREGLARYGTNYSSSRLSNVQLEIFEEAEKYFAVFAGAGAALTMSSGFLAGQLVVRSLSQHASFIYAPRTHPALWRQPTDFFNTDFDQWTSRLPDILARQPPGPVIMLLNSLDALLGKKYNLNWLANLPANRNITLVIDDSHGFGITGRQGAGIFTELSLPPAVRLIVVTSLGKALGIPAGLILSDTDTITTLKQTSVFGGGSPAVPAYLYAILKAAPIYQKAREQLSANIQYFTAKLAQPGFFQTFGNYPVFYTPHNNLYPYLLDHHILISSFPYPTPDSEWVTRVVLNSLHTTEDLDSLVFHINAFSM